MVLYYITNEICFIFMWLRHPLLFGKLLVRIKSSALYIFVLQVTRKKAALIETHSQLRDKVGETASISSGNGPVQLAKLWMFSPLDSTWWPPHFIYMGKHLMHFPSRYPVFEREMDRSSIYLISIIKNKKRKNTLRSIWALSANKARTKWKKHKGREKY